MAARVSSAIRSFAGRIALALIRFWVLAFGRDVSDEAWLDGYAASGERVGPEILDEVMLSHRLVGRRRPDQGLLADFEGLRGPSFSPDDVAARVHDFYERTARYRLGVEPVWSGPLGWVARAFVACVGVASDQCNVPLGRREAAAGMSNEVVGLRRLPDGMRASVCWLRRSRAHGRVVYAGFYGLAKPPLEPGPCVHVSFPFPGGYACVVLRPTVVGRDELELVSQSERFGEAGFYIVHLDRYGRRKAKKVPLVERIRVGVNDEGELYARHSFEFFERFLVLDYGLKVASAARGSARMAA